MSSLALPREAPAVPTRRGRLADLLERRGRTLILAVPIALLAVRCLMQLPAEVNVDSWLELVTGRLIWQHGIPHVETLTVMSHGQAWVDQQWLAQLFSYAIYRVGGLGLLGLINGLMLCVGIGIATVTARRNGAAFRWTLICLAATVAMMLPSREVRTQAFAVPLFALVVYLLAQDSRRPSRRVFWCFPILLLWANLHGTVTMGAMLVGLHGLIVAWERRSDLRRSLTAWRRPLALTVGAVVSILITPYGLSIIGYYHSTMVSSTLRQTVTEWQPVTSMPALAVGVFALSAVAIWSFGRNPDRTTTWEKLALLLLAASAIEVVRNSLFFALIGMAIVPVSLGWSGAEANDGPDRRRILINGLIAVTLGFMLIVATLSALVQPASTIELSSQRIGVLTAVERAGAAHPGVRVLSDEHFDDWLLWRDPGLAGHIADDVRFELLTTAQINRLQSLFDQVGPDFKAAARGYRVLVLDRDYEPDAYKTFLHEPGRQILFRDARRVVILRSAAAAARG